PRSGVQGSGVLELLVWSLRDAELLLRPAQQRLLLRSAHLQLRQPAHLQLLLRQPVLLLRSDGVLRMERPPPRVPSLVASLIDSTAASKQQTPETRLPSSLSTG